MPLKVRGALVQNLKFGLIEALIAPPPYDYTYLLPAKTINTEALVRKSQWFGARLQMFFLFLVGFLAMICHHLFYSFLDGRVVQTGLIVPYFNLNKQILIGAAGNAIAALASFVLGSAIAIAFVQVLWLVLREKGHTVRDIDAALECRTSPFAPQAWRAWISTQRPTLLSILGAAMTLITIFAPSSIHSIPSLTAQNVPCNLSRVDLSSADFDSYISEDGDLYTTTALGLRKMMARNLIGGTYVTPLDPCDGTACGYDLVFNGPALNCSDITGFDFSAYNAWSNANAKQALIWWSNNDISFPTNGSTINVVTMEGMYTGQSAVTCDVYNATYSVSVYHNVTTTANITKLVYGKRVNESDQNAADFNALHYTSLAIAQALEGAVLIDLDAMVQVLGTDWGDSEQVDNNLLIYSSLGAPNIYSSTNPWQWDTDLPSALMEFSKNVSLSLLSNPLATPLKESPGNCQYFGTIYVYQRLHLFITYGAGLGISFICIAYGFYSSHANEHEESLSFSRLFIAILNPDLYDERVDPMTKLKAAASGPDGFSRFGVDKEQRTIL